MRKVFLGLMAAVVFMAGPAMAGIELGPVFDAEVVGGAGSVNLVSFQDEESQDAGDKKSSDWGGFGGPMVMYLMIDLSPLDPMTADRDIDEFEDYMMLYGGGGGLIYKNFRLGGFGFGGSQEVDDEIMNEDADAKITLGGGGVFVEANSALSPNFGLLVGSMFGAGAINLEADGYGIGAGGADDDWEASSGFGFVYPYVGFWVAPVEWGWVQVDGGYLFMDIDATGGDFWADSGLDMVDGSIQGGWLFNLKLLYGKNPAI